MQITEIPKARLSFQSFSRHIKVDPLGKRSEMSIFLRMQNRWMQEHMQNKYDATSRFFETSDTHDLSLRPLERYE